MADFTFYLTSSGDPGSEVPILFGHEVIGTGKISSLGHNVQVFLDPELPDDRRKEFDRIFRDQLRIHGNYESGDLQMPDGTMLGCEGSIEIYCV